MTLQGARRRRVLNALKWLVTLGAFAFLLLRQPLTELGNALARVSPLAVLAGVAVLCFAIFLSAFRWALTMRAYGADRVPGVAALQYFTWLAVFYNTYLPGAVGGDVVRGLALRDVFDEEATTRGLAVVFIDRVLGMAGLLCVVSVATLVQPIAGLELPRYLVALGPVAAAGTVLAIAAGRRLGMALPGRLGAFFTPLPTLSRGGPLMGALAMAVLNHVLVALAGHVLVASISDVPSLTDSLVAVPLATAAAFIPISVAGLGLRDTAFVALYELIGVDRALALAGALALMVCLLTAAGLGGLWQLVRPLPTGWRSEAAPSETTPPA